MNHKPLLSLSVVVHNQADLARHLLDDINALDDKPSLEVVFTVNTDEALPFQKHDYFFPLQIIRNKRPKGYGANHNQAFQHSRGEFFCILNPDIRITDNPFGHLIDCLEQKTNGVAAPEIVNPSGTIENTARYFPTPLSILKKAITGSTGLDYHRGTDNLEVDWVGGMFMLFSRKGFEAVQGFDERYFLYYEDVDICARLKLKGLSVLLCRNAKAIHDGRADSHRNIKYMQWHIRSMARYFTSEGFWKLVLPARLKG